MSNMLPPGYKLVSANPTAKQVYALRQSLGFSTDNPTDEEQKTVLKLCHVYATMIDAAPEFTMEISASVAFEEVGKVDNIFFDPVSGTPNEIGSDDTIVFASTEPHRMVDVEDVDIP